MALQHLRSSTAHKRPIPTVMSAGQIAINTNEASPALFFKDSNGDLVKVGPVHVGTSAPNSSPASVAATALVTGTVYQILTVGTTDFTLVGAGNNNIGTIFTATGATTGTGTVSGQQGVEKGEMWLDTTGGTYVLKIYDGTDWRSESGTFVDSAGDTMTGALLLDNAASASAPDLSFDGDADTGVYSPGANQLALATNGTNRLHIASDGKVGVGTTSVANNIKLEIQDSGSTGINIRNTNDSANDTRRIAFSQGSGNLTSSNTVADIFGRTQGVSPLTGAIIFRTNRGNDVSEAVRIDESGRLLVGTSSTSLATTALLQGDSESSAFGAKLTLARGVAASSMSTGNLLGRIGFTDSTHGLFASIEAESDGSSGTDDYPGRLVFSTTADGDSSPDPRMTIKSDGKVGIGTTSPSTTFEVIGDAKIGNTSYPIRFATGTSTGVIEYPATSSRSVIRTLGATPLEFEINSSPVARFDTSGRLLVGASSSSGGTNNTTELVVNGGMRSRLVIGSGNTTFTPNYTFQDGLYAIAYRVTGQDKGFIGYVSCINGNATITTLTNRGSSAPTVVAGPQIRFPTPGGNYGKRVTITLLTGLAD